MNRPLCSILFFFVAAVALTEAKRQTPPPLPYLSFSTWAVFTNNVLLPNGSTRLTWSYGEHVQVDWRQKVRCRYEVQELQPIMRQWSWTTVANYSAGWEKSKVQTQNGTSINCTQNDISKEKLQPGGDWWLAPNPVTMARLVFLEFVVVGQNVNSSLYQWTTIKADGTTVLLQWYISVEGHIPQLYVNKTWNPITKMGSILTTAFVGYHELEALNEACLYPGCGAEKCRANINAPPQSIINAIGWACGEPSINCNNVSYGGANYFPNTVVAHGNFVFDEYFQVNSADGVSACDFGGSAVLVTCPTTCRRCNATAKATDVQLGHVLDWLCSPEGIQDCTPITPNGQYFYPNTTRAHVNWAMNVYFQAYQCTPGVVACDFNGTATIVNC